MGFIFNRGYLLNQFAVDLMLIFGCPDMGVLTLKTGLILLGAAVVGAVPVVGAIASSNAPITASAANQRQVLEISQAAETKQAEAPELSDEWRPMTEDEEDMQWDFILNSPMGIAALNQLAIEGFISPVCTKTFYTNEQYGGFQTLMKVQCPTPRGVSSAVSYDEIWVTFNRFESNIESFTVQRFGQN